MSDKCSPGDLAMIRGCVDDTKNNGWLVLVVENVTGRCWFAPDNTFHCWSDGGASTAVESLGSPFYDDGSKFAVFDSRKVVPIRDPGDDAVDEMLLPRELLEHSHA